MESLHVVCDDCLVNLGISRIHMNGPELMMIYGPMMEGPLGDTYTCPCGRFYSVILGYFNFISDQGMTRQRPVPRCESALGKLEPLYVRKPLSEGRALFACPACGQEQENNLHRIS